jgi:hypothetical protein
LSGGAALSRLTNALTSHGSAIRHNNGQIMAQCPAHPDKNPSLSIRATEGQVLVYCFAGCATSDVIAAVGLTNSDLFDDPRGATYRYDDGRVVKRSPDKRFRQTGNTKGAPQLYRAGRLTENPDSDVFLVEGEKDVHAVESAGGLATCNPMGSSNFDKVDVGPLRGRTVTAVVDRDAGGLKWAAQVRARLVGYAANVAFVESAAGKDAADHVAAGYGLTDFVQHESEPEPDAPEPIEAEYLVPENPWEGATDANGFPLEPEYVPDWVEDDAAGLALQQDVAEAEAVAAENGEGPGEGRRIAFRSAATMRMARTRWLHGHEQGGHVPLGAITLLAGREGIGKSTISYDFIAKVTLGTLRGEYYGIPKGVVVYATEDDWEPVILPRLVAAGADLNQVHRVDAYEGEEKDWISFPRDLVRLGRICKEHNVALLVLDPIMSIIDGKLDTHKDREVRQVLDPLARFAAAAGAAVIGLIHVNKSGGGDAVNSVMGSRAFSAVARSVLFCIAVPKQDDDGGPDEFLFSQEKCNLGPKQGSQKYGIETVELQGSDEEGKPFKVFTSRVVWGNGDVRRAGDVMEEQARASRPKGKLREEILLYLRSQEGGVPLGDIVAALPDHKEGNIKVTLSRMVDANQITRPVIGLYAAGSAR